MNNVTPPRDHAPPRDDDEEDYAAILQWLQDHPELADQLDHLEFDGR